MEAGLRQNIKTLRMEEYEGRPPGTRLLRFSYSDGDAGRWASLDAKYRHLAPNEKPSIEWRRKTGKAVAEMLGLPCEYSKQSYERADRLTVLAAPEQYCVASWPSGYSLAEVSRGSGSRKDYYLLGE